MNPTESFIELKYFSPFDIEKIPKRILEIVQENATGCKFTHFHVTLPEFLLLIWDETELRNDIRKELITYYSSSLDTL